MFLVSDIRVGTSSEQSLDHIARAESGCHHQVGHFLREEPAIQVHTHQARVQEHTQYLIEVLIYRMNYTILSIPVCHIRVSPKLQKISHL